MGLILNDIGVIVIGGSAGSYNIVRKILSSLPVNFSVPIVMCLHRLKEFRSGFAESLNINSVLPVKEAQDKECLRPGTVYLSPANYHLMIEPDYTLALSTEDVVNYSRPSIDIIFESAGYSLKRKMAGILLSGTNTDGARGLFSAFRQGAVTAIQNPEEAQFGIMPNEVLSYFKPHFILGDSEITQFINSLNTNSHA